MSKILVTPEQLRQTARTFRSTQDSFKDILVTLNRANDTLGSGIFQISQQQQVEATIRDALNRGNHMHSSVGNLERLLEQYADAFEQADNQGASAISGTASRAPVYNINNSVLPAVGVGVSAGALWNTGKLANSSSSAASSSEVLLQWVPALNPAKNALEIAGKSAIDTLENTPYSWFDSVGRWINANMLGNLHGGAVGFMNNAGHILRSTPVVCATSGILAGVGGVISFLNDPDTAKGNYLRAGETAIVDTGINIGISSVAAPVTLTNAGVQLAGFGVESYANFMGGMSEGEMKRIWAEQAASLQDNFDSINLGNITSDISHLIVDSLPAYFYLNPATAPAAFGMLAGDVISGRRTPESVAAEFIPIADQLGKDFSFLWGHVSGLPVGLARTTIDVCSVIDGAIITDISFVSQIIPLSPSQRAGLDDFFITWQQETTNLDSTII